MLSIAKQAALAAAIQGVQQKNAQTQQQGTQLILNQQNQASAAAGATKPKAATKAKAATKPKATKVPASTITPYLTADDLLNTSAAVANSEAAQSQAGFDFAGAAANAQQQLGDIGRQTTANVANANDDAAARGLYNSGIRAGNVGQAQAAGVRAATNTATDFRLAAAQAIARRQQAQNQLSDFTSGMVAKSAENGAALPVDPYSNVKGAATLKKTKAVKH